MQHAIPSNRIAKEQYSRPGRKSIDHALNRRLIFDLSRYQKSSLAMTSCDLKNCYDRVAHTPAMLALLGFGVPKQPLLSLFHAIQHMQYHTRTVYGDSKPLVVLKLDTKQNHKDLDRETGKLRRAGQH